MNIMKIFRSFSKWVCIIMVITILQLSFTVAMEGMWLFGIPAPDRVTSVTITYPYLTDKPLEITDSEQIKTCVHLSAFLKYKPFASTEISTGTNSPITFVYHVENGEDIEVSANATFVFYNGKTHVLKENQAFVKFVEGLFYTKFFVN